jgi:hypothetical protein
MKLSDMLVSLSRQCGPGVKANSKIHHKHWRSYKLHLDVAGSQILTTRIPTSANAHDAKVAIPLMDITGHRVIGSYDLMDSAYDANAVLEQYKQLGYVPIADPNGRRVTRKSA